MLVAAWSFNDSTASDVTGRGHDGTLINTPTFPAGHEGLGIQFASASSQNVSVPDHADWNLGTRWTMMCWFKPTTLVVGELICKQNQWWFSTTATGQVAHGFYYSGGGNTNGIGSVATMSAGAWSHLAARYDGTTYSVVFNGVQSNSSTDAGAASGKTMIDAATSVRMGSWEGTTEFQNGVLDDGRIFDTYLTDADIAYWMNTPVAIPSSPPDTRAKFIYLRKNR